MTTKTESKAPSAQGLALRKTLADVLAAVERNTALSPTRLRDLRSSVIRVADLLGNVPARIALDLPTIAARLAAISPVAAGMTPKRFANVRSDFLAAVRASGLMPMRQRHKGRLAPAWRQLFARLSRRRAHLGLSRFARYASARGIDPEAVNDATVADFITAVREQSLHRTPNWLYRQVTRIWNEAARDAELGLQSLTVPSFRGPPKRIDWALLSRSFRRDVDKFLKWASQSDPFAPDSCPRRLAPRTLRLRRDQISRRGIRVDRHRHETSRHSLPRRSRYAGQLQKDSAASCRDGRWRAKFVQSEPRHSTDSDCARMGEG